ncbi:MAG: hypothetical protein JWR15_1296 [Prosthecobacter sp.]|nr:hypothetical protein [Prosthecobacter sp.]
MFPKSVFCLATSRIQAGQIVDRLKAASFSSNDISALFADHHGGQDLAHMKHTLAAEAAMGGAGIGVVVGGALGWLTGLGILALPGGGSLIAIGPGLAALIGAALGAFLGGISGGLTGMGFQKLGAKPHDGGPQDGNILISVHTQNAAEITQAEVIFAFAGGRDICTSEEVPVSADDRATELIMYPAVAGLKGPAR